MIKNKLLSKIGIIGGGQLGKMMILEAKKMGFFVAILDPTESCPAHSIADFHIKASFDDEKAIRELAKMTDVITYEFEHINASFLSALENEGFKIYPTAKSLKIIQDKFFQKELLRKGNILVPEFYAVESLEDLKSVAKKLGYPFILKNRTGGYDGKGNAVVKNEDDIDNSYELLGGNKKALMAEKLIDFQIETSVLSCRSLDGKIVIYPMGENIHEENILRKTRVPADIPEGVYEKAVKLSEKTCELFDAVGMFCLELFIDKKHEVYVNEIAPRPHNSGHYTIEACVTSQFENHIRAITNLPLGSSKLLSPVVMCNILGEDNVSGKAFPIGIEKALEEDRVKVHLYGKEYTSPKRKMGHLTVTADTLEEADKIADKAESYIKVTVNSNNF